MDGTFEVIGYTADYPYINLGLKNNNPKEYKLALIVCHNEEFKKGMQVERIYKTTKKGTSIKYKHITSKEDAIKYREKIQNMVNEFEKEFSLK